jgi:hypothetical protein
MEQLFTDPSVISTLPSWLRDTLVDIEKSDIVFLNENETSADTTNDETQQSSESTENKEIGSSSAATQETVVTNSAEQSTEIKKDPVYLEPSFVPTAPIVPGDYYSGLLNIDQTHDTAIYNLFMEAGVVDKYVQLLSSRHEKMAQTISFLQKVATTPVTQYRIVQRIQKTAPASSSESNARFSLSLPKGKVDASKLPSSESMLKSFSNSHSAQKVFRETYSVSSVDVEESKVNGSIANITRSTIGKIVSTQYTFGDLVVRGNGMKSLGVHMLVGEEEPNQQMFSNNNNYGGGGGYNNYGYAKHKDISGEAADSVTIRHHSTFSELRVSKTTVDIIDKKAALRKAAELFALDNSYTLKADLCYYSNKESQFIVPAYHITGTSSIQSSVKTFGSAGSIQNNESLTFKIPKNLSRLAYYCWVHQSMLSDFALTNKGVIENKKIYVRLNSAPFSSPYYIFSDTPNGEALNTATSPLVLRRESTYELVRTDSGHIFNVGTSWRKNDTGMKVTSTSIVGLVTWTETSVVNETIHLLEKHIPASPKHEPILDLGKSTLRSPTAVSEKVDFGFYAAAVSDSDVATGILPQTRDMLVFRVDIPDITFKNTSSVETVCSHGNVTPLKYGDKHVNITIPKKINADDVEKLSSVTVYVTETNIYGFSKTKQLRVDVSKYFTQFQLTDQTFQVAEAPNGTQIYNYGIEWAETPLGTTIYSRFLNEMNKSSYKQYAFDSSRSREQDFKDKENSGKDDYFVDNVDVSVYMGHGNGNGFGFVQNIDDNRLTFTDARGGQAWGNRDMEYMALMSCQVLRDTANNLSWAERWGGAFNGLHLICGFQTNAGVDGNNMLKFFAENMHSNKQTVMNSWINAALNDQDTGREAVVMGPLVGTADSTFMDYKSMSATNAGMYRAYWNDYTWGVSGGPGYDANRTSITGWWRLVVRV